MLGVGYGRLQHLLHDLGGFLTAESQQVERTPTFFPRIWSATKRAFWAEIRAPDNLAATSIVLTP